MLLIADPNVESRRYADKSPRIGPQKLLQSISRLIHPTAGNPKAGGVQVPSGHYSSTDVRPNVGLKPFPQSNDVPEAAESSSDPVKKSVEDSASPEQTSSKRQERGFTYRSETTQSNDKAPANDEQSGTKAAISKTDAVPHRSRRTPDTTNVGQTADQGGLHILLVDDNDINLNILKACMKRAKLSFKAAVNGLEAVQMFGANIDSAHSFTHVLMDISMPIMDGIEATRRIRNIEQTHRKRRRRRSTHGRSDAGLVSQESPAYLDTKSQAEESSRAEEREQQVMSDNATSSTNDRAMVIALSGVASEQAQEEMFEAGADMFLPKPINMKRLVEVIKS